MSNSGADERRDLMERFLQELERNRADVYFDESDLVEIYDYARDTQDFRVCLEVLLLASRLYPGSVALGERLAFYMYDLGSVDGAESMLKQVPEESVLRRLLSLQIKMLPKEEACAELERILESVKDFEDEWAIRLVDIAGNYNALDWLKENYDRIKAKCSYPQSFIYEMFELSFSLYDYETAQKLGEELTLLEPFNEEFWELLGELRIRNLEAYEAGLSDVEYALAIDPCRSKALQLKAEALLGLDRPVEDIMQVLGTLLKSAPEEEEYVHTLSLALFTKGYEVEAIQALEEFRNTHPDSAATLTYLVLLTKGNVSLELLAPMFSTELTGDSGYEDVADTARRFAKEGEYGAASTLLLAMDKYVGAGEHTAYMYELLYRARRYSEALEKWSQLKAPCNVADLVAVFSALRVGDRQFVVDNVSAMIERWSGCEDSETFSDRVARLGTLYALSSVRQTVVVEGSDFNFNNSDPFSLS